MNNSYNQPDPGADFSKFFDKNKQTPQTGAGAIVQKPKNKIKRKYIIYVAVLVILVVIQIVIMQLTQPPKPAAVTPPNTNQK